MMNALFLLKMCALSALTCVYWITFTCASFTSALSLPTTTSLQSIELGTNASKGLSSEKADDVGALLKNSTIEAKPTNDTRRKSYHEIVDSMLHARKRSAKFLISPEFTMDKFVTFVTASNNLLNSQTNYPKLDKLTKSFSNLINSDGLNAAAVFWDMWVCVWTVIDAVSNVFRAYETRVLNTIDENQPLPADPLEDLQQSLDDANNNIAVVSDLFQQLNRMGEFGYGSSEQQDNVRTRRQRLLQEVSHHARDDKKEDSSNQDNENRDEFEEEDKLRRAKQIVNVQRKKKQHLTIKKNRRFYYPIGYRSNPANNPKNHRSLTEASDYRALRSRRNKPSVVGQKSNQNSQTSKPAPDGIRKRSGNISFDRTGADRKHRGIRIKRSNSQYNFGVDKFIYFMSKAYNVMNSNTNNRQLNRFTRAFNDLFASDGLEALNLFYTLLASFWTIVDAVANVFRFNEARIRDQILQQQEAGRPDPLEDLQAELSDTNTNLAEVADLISALQNEAAARLDTTNAKAHRGSSRHPVHHTKSNQHVRPTHEGNKHRVLSTPSPRQTTPHFGNQESFKSHSMNTEKNVSFSPVATHPHSHFTGGGWKPVTKSPQSFEESKRGFLPPVSYGNYPFRDRQHYPLSFSTDGHVRIDPHSRGKSNAVTVHRVSHQHSSYANRHDRANALPRGLSEQRPPSQLRDSTSHRRYRTYGDRTGRHSKINRRYAKTSGIVKSYNN